MRRQYFWWTFLVGGIVCFIYGGYTLIYHFNHNNSLSVHSLILLILGSLALIICFIFLIISFFQNKKNKQSAVEKQPEITNTEEKTEEKPKSIVTPKQNEEVTNSTTSASKQTTSYKPHNPQSCYSGYEAYINKVGYGPVLRVSEERFLDMRTNTYYRIQGNIVYQDGSGPVYEINSNRIKLAFGSYLYEISGGNVNKVFGGFFASISGNSITKYDASEKYEMSSPLNRQQLLVVVALLFGQY